MKTLVLTVTINDCEQQFFRSGGPGGQNQNKRETGVRIIHHPSGARGEARDERSREQNRKLAFNRMASSPEFYVWAKQQSCIPTLDKELPKERIRTYNFSQRRVTDHRTGKTICDIESILDGDIDLIK